jgi:phosphoenolpyruvate carboxykinase (GTP)
MDERISRLIEKYRVLCRPKKVTILTDSQEDMERVRDIVIENREEYMLKTNKHTIHFDGVKDQARDRENTRLFLEEGIKTSEEIKTIERDAGEKEIKELLEGIMEGKEMFVKFVCLGPRDSEFSIPAVQLTDSAYVVHSNNILFRAGYEQFMRKKPDEDFFTIIHSAGKLDDRMNSMNLDKRRMYIDPIKNIVYSVNTQYAGNSVGFKKLALRLAINKADKEGWLAEHMFIMGVCNNGRKTYFAGAFPSGCGKTSTSMIEGCTIIGDDLAYLRRKNNEIRGVNAEQGIFGIINGINQKNDPLIWKALRNSGEIIFSNVLIKDGMPYWEDMGIELPSEGYNFQGEWKKGMKNGERKIIPASHANARFALRLEDLVNVDDKLHNPDGVRISGIIYGGRDPDTSPPVFESFNWEHGVCMIGASLESKTTFTVLDGGEKIEHNPMANLDFVIIPLSKYIKNHLKIADGLKDKDKPRIFSVNYFLQDKDGTYLNEINDKGVWVRWMEGRVHDEYSAIETPIGMIPKYEDLSNLFKRVLNKDYLPDDYKKQFCIRVDKWLEKLDRIEDAYKKESDNSVEFLRKIHNQKQRLLEAKEKYGAVISPFSF